MPPFSAVSEDRVTTNDIALPAPKVGLSQDREWCVVKVNGGWKRIRFHDYDKIYAIPGLYETLFYDVLECDSPRKVAGMLRDCLDKAAVSPGDLRVLDLGAGNGMVGEELAKLGVRRIFGVDIYEAAAAATRRDRRDVYENYFVLDVTDLSELDSQRLRSLRLNCLTCVAALGFDDVPLRAFRSAFNHVEPGGWVAFNIKSGFLEADESMGFAALIRRMIDSGRITIHAGQQYRHRLATNGTPLHYTAFVGVKHGDVPPDWKL